VNQRLDDLEPMTCSMMALYLSDYRRGETLRSATTAIEAHLSKCARCARELKELEEVEAWIGRDRDIPSGELAQARLQLQRAMARDDSAPTPRTMAPWRSILLHAAGFLVLVAVLAPILSRFSTAVRSENTQTASLFQPWMDEVRSVREQLSLWIPETSARQWLKEAPREATRWMWRLTPKPLMEMQETPSSSG